MPGRFSIWGIFPNPLHPQTSKAEVLLYNPGSVSNPSPAISVIIPAYNEEGNISDVINGVSRACAGVSHEILIVDDGSTDGTAVETGLIANDRPSVRLLRLKRNFGQTAAMAAGIDHARGDVVIPMDADGQNDPADIPNLLAKLNEGYDIVSGWRRERKDPFLSRRLPSQFANALISLATGVHLHDYGCTLKAYRRSIISGIKLYGEMHRFLPAWCAWQGGRIAELPVRHHPRVRGQSKYGLTRTFKVMIDLMTVKFFSHFLSKPNYLFSGSGFLLVGLSFGSALIAFIDKFGPDRIPQYRLPLLLLAVFFGLTAVFLIMMGLIAELLVRLYFQLNDQKPYRLADE